MTAIATIRRVALRSLIPPPRLQLSELIEGNRPAAKEVREQYYDRPWGYPGYQPQSVAACRHQSAWRILLGNGHQVTRDDLRRLGQGISGACGGGAQGRRPTCL
jgi:hypothetical protein